MPRNTKEDSGTSPERRSSDEEKPPRAKKGRKEVHVEVSTPRKGRKSSASSAARAKKAPAVRAAPPNVEILIKKPPSIWASTVRADPQTSGGKQRESADDPDASSDDKTTSPSKAKKGPQRRTRTVAKDASPSKRQKPKAREEAPAKIRTRKVSKVRSASETRSTSLRKTSQRSSLQKRRRTAPSPEQKSEEFSTSDIRAVTPEMEAPPSEDSSERVAPQVSPTAPEPPREQTVAEERTETAAPENRESAAELMLPRREYRAGQQAEAAGTEYCECTPRSPPSPDEYRSVYTAGAASWMACQCAPCQQVHVRSGAVAHVAVNSGKHTVHVRSYDECQQLKDATNYIGMSLFNMLQQREGENVCLSVYGLSFLVALFGQRAANSKGAFKQDLKYGAMVPTPDGHVTYPCEQVVTTLTRRVAEDGELKVNTEVYTRNHSATDQEFRQGKACSLRNVTSHIFTAQLRTLTADGAQAVREDVLFNTARFENLWRCSFDRNATRRGDFFNNWSDRVTVSMMRKTSILPYSFYPDLDTDVVCLPYADGALCMTLLLERSPSPSFPALTPDNLCGFIHGTRDRLVSLQLPKFGVDSSIELGELLAGLAHDLADDTCRLQFRHAHQETHISVAEGDWHGACAQRPTFSGSPVTVVFDKPFYFVITDRTRDVILYVGRVTSLGKETARVPADRTRTRSCF